MKDDVEDRLRKYRPSGPPPELCDRVMQAADAAVVARPVVSGVARPFQGRVRGWLPAALAASIAIIFHLLASSTRADVASRLGDADRAREAMVTELATQLGGDEFARQSAEQLIEANEQSTTGQPSIPDGIDR
jgi:hypothetical protein